MCSENEGADQLHGYREAGLRLKFCLSIFFLLSYAVAHIHLPETCSYCFP